MSEQQLETSAAPEVQPGTEAEPAVYTREEVDALITKATEKAAQMAFESVQGYTDKREKELQVRVNSAVEALEQSGITASPEVKLQLRNRFNQDIPGPKGEEEAQEPPAQGFPPNQPQVPYQQQMPPHVIQADAILAAANVPHDAPELRGLNWDEPGVVQQAFELAGKYRQQPPAQQQPPQQPIARMPNVSAQGQAAGGSLEQQYERAMEQAKKTNPYLSREEKMRIRREWREKGATI
jgi:hypothetical protein